MSTEPSSLRRRCAQWFLGMVTLNAIAIVAAWGELFLRIPKVFGWGLSAISIVPAMFALAVLVVPVSFVMVVISIFWPRLRRSWGEVFLCSAIVSVLCVGGIMLSSRITQRGFRELADRSAPLVGAIRQFEKDRGQPPRDLEEVVRAGYLTEVPETPCGCSEYRYRLNRHGNPWVLTVRPPFRGIGFDSFDYWPKQDYPEWGESGWYERVGEWAYYHE